MKTFQTPAPENYFVDSSPGMDAGHSDILDSKRSLKYDSTDAGQGDRNLSPAMSSVSVGEGGPVVTRRELWSYYCASLIQTVFFNI